MPAQRHADAAPGQARPRVLHLLSTTQRRGAELFAMRLAEHLQGGVFDNTLCALEISEKNAASGPEGVPLIGLSGGGGRRKLPGDPATVWRLRKLLRSEDPAVVIGHGGSTLRYTALSKCLRPRTRTVYINIGMASHWANSAMKLRMNRALLRRVDTVVSVSQTSRADFQRHYSVPESKTVYIPNGADVSRFTAAQDQGARNAARAELGLGPQAVAMLTAGSLTSEKNQTVLVPVLAELRKQGLDAHLLIAGAGPLMQGIEQSSAKLHVESALHVLGPVSDVPRVMAAADIFVLPSKTEGMPGVLIEAGMAGLPSVSFNVGGVAEVISDGQTGLLVAPDDLPGMVTAVSRLMRGPALRASMGAAAATKCRSQFDMREVAGQYEQLLIALTAQGRSVPVPGESRQSG